jgi:hypothetical protein
MIGLDVTQMVAVSHVRDSAPAVQRYSSASILIQERWPPIKRIMSLVHRQFWVKPASAAI